MVSLRVLADHGIFEVTPSVIRAERQEFQIRVKDSQSLDYEKLKRDTFKVRTREDEAIYDPTWRKALTVW